MASITLRGIDERVLSRIRVLARSERRSLNSELLRLIERALEEDVGRRAGRQRVSASTQLDLWRAIAGTWQDDRPTVAIISDIYDGRTPGRDIEL